MAEGRLTGRVRNANVISMTSPRVDKGRTVLVENGRIVSTDFKPKDPKGATVIDATGKYLMPGLAEMHGHVPPLNAPNNQTEDVLFLYVDDETRNRLMAFAKHFGFLYQIDESEASVAR